MPDIQVLADVQPRKLNAMRADHRQDVAAVALGVVDHLCDRYSSGRPPAIHRDHLAARGLGIPGQGIPARGQFPGQPGQRLQRRLLGGNGWARCTPVIVAR